MKSHIRLRLMYLSSAAAFVALLALVGCSTPTPASSPTGSTEASQPASTPSTATALTENSQGENLYTPVYVPNGREVAVVKTNRGTIRIKLYGNDAPINTANFIELARSGFYNGTRFHRLEPGFVVQGGDPQTKKLSKSQVVKLVKQQSNGTFAQGQPALGTGGPGRVVKGEFDPSNVAHQHVDGTLAAARTDDPDSAGSQFYLALAPLPDLDGKYTVFGDTASGLTVVHALRVGDLIKSITIENATK